MGGRILLVLATNDSGNGGDLLAGRVGSGEKGKLGKDKQMSIEGGDESPFKIYILMMDTRLHLIKLLQREDMKWREDLNMT